MALCLVGALSACGSGSEHTGPGTAPATTTPTGPSFDCAKAGSEAEKLVCNDPGLAALDRRLADEYDKALNRPGADKSTLQGAQHGWATGRDDCAQAGDVSRCVRESYQTRIFELRTSDPAVPAPPVVTYSCPGDKAFTARFYHEFDPRVAVLTWGEDSAVTFGEPAASGAKYGRDGIDFWEHHGEVKVNFFGNEFTCHTT